MVKKQFIPLNIQLFAEDDGNGDGGAPKTYSQSDIDKLNAELEKFKKANDNLSKENAEHKRKAKEKLTEEEKIAQAQKEKDDLLANTQKELLAIKMSKEFMIAGFDEKTTEEIVKCFNEKDSVEFARSLSTHIKNLIENVRKEEKEKFNQSSTIPPNGSGKQTSGLDPVVERYIKKKNTNNSKAEEILFGKK